MKTKLWVGLAIAALSLGCYRNVYKIGGGAPTTGAPVSRAWQNHFLYGLVGNPTIDVGTLCPSGRATLVNRYTPLNSLVASLTAGLYTPTTTLLYCAAPGAASPSPDGARAAQWTESQGVEGRIDETR
jgi:hypothetical protein